MTGTTQMTNRRLQNSCENEEVPHLTWGVRGINMHRFSTDSSIMKMKIIARFRQTQNGLLLCIPGSRQTRSKEEIIIGLILLRFPSDPCKVFRMGEFCTSSAQLRRHEMHKQDKNIWASSWKDSLWWLELNDCAVWVSQWFRASAERLCNWAWPWAQQSIVKFFFYECRSSKKTLCFFFGSSH